MCSAFYLITQWQDAWGTRPHQNVKKGNSWRQGFCYSSWKASLSHLIQDFWCCHIKEFSNRLRLCQLAPSSPVFSCQPGCENFSAHSSFTTVFICASKEFLIFQLPVLLPNKYIYCLKRKKKKVERKSKILLLKWILDILLCGIFHSVSLQRSGKMPTCEKNKKSSSLTLLACQEFTLPNVACLPN